MSITAASRRLSAILIEYDCRGKRARRTFADNLAARRFYLAKSKAGKNPKVVSAVRG